MIVVLVKKLRERRSDLRNTLYLGFPDCFFKGFFDAIMIVVLVKSHENDVPRFVPILFLRCVVL